MYILISIGIILLVILCLLIVKGTIGKKCFKCGSHLTIVFSEYKKEAISPSCISLYTETKCMWCGYKEREWKVIHDREKCTHEENMKW